LFFIIDLIHKSNGTLLTENQIKTQLYQEYIKYLPNYKNKILDILTIQGKKTLCDQVKKETLSFINFIYTDSYFFTTLDLWILIEKYKIPSFFISSKFLLETDYQKHSFNAYGGKEAQRFVFIVIPGLRNENVPSYKLICDDKNSIFISIDKLVNAERIEELNEPHSTVEDYLKKFSKNATTNYNKKMPIPPAKAEVVKRRFRYIDDPIIIEDKVPITQMNPNPNPKKKVKLRILDKPRVISESFIDEVKELNQAQAPAQAQAQAPAQAPAQAQAPEPKKKKTKKQKAKEIQIKGEKSKTRRLKLNRVNPIKESSSSSVNI
jgi:hypothetical protein